jgi:hypothetical protein
MSVRLRQQVRKYRRRLGLAIYGRPGRFGTIALVKGWPPPPMEFEPELTQEERLAIFAPKQPPLTPEEKRMWEHLGVHVYEEDRGYD